MLTKNPEKTGGRPTTATGARVRAGAMHTTTPKTRQPEKQSHGQRLTATRSKLGAAYEVAKNRMVRNYLAHFREEDWDRVVRLTVLYGVQALRARHQVEKMTVGDLQDLVEENNVALAFEDKIPDITKQLEQIKAGLSLSQADVRESASATKSASEDSVKEQSKESREQPAATAPKFGELTVFPSEQAVAANAAPKPTMQQQEANKAESAQTKAVVDSGPKKSIYHKKASSKWRRGETTDTYESIKARSLSPAGARRQHVQDPRASVEEILYGGNPAACGPAMPYRAPNWWMDDDEATRKNQEAANRKKYIPGQSRNAPRLAYSVEKTAASNKDESVSKSDMATLAYHNVAGTGLGVQKSDAQPSPTSVDGASPGSTASTNPFATRPGNSQTATQEANAAAVDEVFNKLFGTKPVVNQPPKEQAAEKAPKGVSWTVSMGPGATSDPVPNPPSSVAPWPFETRPSGSASQQETEKPQPKPALKRPESAKPGQRRVSIPSGKDDSETPKTVQKQPEVSRAAKPKTPSTVAGKKNLKNVESKVKAQIEQDRAYNKLVFQARAKEVEKAIGRKDRTAPVPPRNVIYRKESEENGQAVNIADRFLRSDISSFFVSGDTAGYRHRFLDGGSRKLGAATTYSSSSDDEAVIMPRKNAPAPKYSTWVGEFDFSKDNRKTAGVSSRFVDVSSSDSEDERAGADILKRIYDRAGQEKVAAPVWKDFVADSHQGDGDGSDDGASGDEHGRQFVSPKPFVGGSFEQGTSFAQFAIPPKEDPGSGVQPDTDVIDDGLLY